jgi:hypothetical protein
MKSRNSTISWAVILIAACSLFSMFGTLQVDQIVHGDLYKYGLQFNYAWATPYWNTTGFIFAMGWFNIVVALIVEVRLLAVKRKSSKRTKSQAKKETILTEAAREQEAEKPKPAETQAQTEEPQTVIVGINVQEKEEKPIEVTETPQVKPQPDQVKEQAEQMSNGVRNYSNLVRKQDLEGKQLEIDTQKPPEDSNIKGMSVLFVREKGTSNTFSILLTTREIQEIIMWARSGRPFTFAKQGKPQSDQVKEQTEQISPNPEEAEAQQEEVKSGPPEGSEETPVVSQPASL